MRLYVLNCTNRNKAVNYRTDYAVDDNGQKLLGQSFRPFRRLAIPPGTQIQFGGNLDPVQFGNIVEQLESPSVGGCHLKDIKTAKAQGEVKLLWSQDVPIPEPICRDVLMHNQAYLTASGARRRETMAIAAGANLENALETNINSLELEMTTSEADGAASDLEEGIRLKRPEGKPSNRKPRRQ